MTDWNRDLIQHRLERAYETLEDAKTFNDLFERRQESDYVDFVQFTESQVYPWIEKTEKFVAFIDNLSQQDRDKL